MAKLDSYSIYARAFPVYITIAPIVLVLFAILPGGFNWGLGGAAGIVAVDISPSMLAILDSRIAEQLAEVGWRIQIVEADV